MSSTPREESSESAAHGRKTLADTPLRKYFDAAARFEASDLLLRGGHPAKLRLRGVLKALDAAPVPPEEFERMVESTLSSAQQAQFDHAGSLDLGVDFPMSDGSTQRFRINLFRSRSRSAIAARRVNNKILSFEQLTLPPVFADIAQQHQGLVLVVGVTGSGKSTTLATMIDTINQRRACHIVTVEDPIEYLFVDARATIHQREIGIDVPDFSTALRALVRENPDVVLIGEMRDKETFEAALRSAETGHLVLGTLHASTTSQAFGRIYDLFAPDELPIIRNTLAYQMHAIICQRLLPSLNQNPERVPATEVLLQSPPTRKYILEAREHELDQVIRAERDAGMHTLTDSLVRLVEQELVHPQVAIEHAINPQEVKMRLRGIKTE